MVYHFVHVIYFSRVFLIFFLSTTTKQNQNPTNRKNKELHVCRSLLFKQMASEDRNYLLDGTNEQDSIHSDYLLIKTLSRPIVMRLRKMTSANNTRVLARKIQMNNKKYKDQNF